MQRDGGRVGPRRHHARECGGQLTATTGPAGAGPARSARAPPPLQHEGVVGQRIVQLISIGRLAVLQQHPVPLPPVDLQPQPQVRPAGEGEGAPQRPAVLLLGGGPRLGDAAHGGEPVRAEPAENVHLRVGSAESAALARPGRASSPWPFESQQSEECAHPPAVERQAQPVLTARSGRRGELWRS